MPAATSIASRSSRSAAWRSPASTSSSLPAMPASASPYAMPSSRQIAFDRSSFSRAVAKSPRRASMYGPASRAFASTAGRSCSCAHASCASTNSAHSDSGVGPKSMQPPTSSQALIWRSTSPEAIACSRARSSALELADAVALAQTGRAHQLPGVGEILVGVEDRDGALGGGLQLVRARRSEHVREVPRSTAARSSLSSSPSDRASSIASARTAWPPRGRRIRAAHGRAAAGAEPAAPALGQQRARASSERHGRHGSPRTSAARLACASSAPPRNASSGSRRPSSAPSSYACSRWKPMISSRPARSAVAPLEPVGEARMQARAQLLRHRRVGDVADQHVVEAEAVVAREERAVGAHELLAPERRAACRRRRPRPRAARSTAPRWKRRPSTDAALDDRALLGLEPVDARGEQRLDRRRHACRRRGSSRKCASSCSTKSGLPSAVATTRSRSSGASSCASRADELVRVVVAERLEHDERRARRGAAQDGRTSKRSGRAVQRTKIGAPLDEAATYSTRSSSAGSAQWMSSTTSTSGRVGGERLEQPPERPGGLVAASRRRGARRPRRRRAVAAQSPCPSPAKSSLEVAERRARRPRAGGR